MTNRAEDYIETITTFEFKVFDKAHKDYLYDATPEQCCNYVWQKYYSSAKFTKMTVFNIPKAFIIHIDKMQLNSIVNVHGNGHDEDMNKASIRMRDEKIESFKKKHGV